MLQAFTIMSLVFAAAATVAIFIFVLPEKKYESLPTFLKVVAHIFDFKELLLEKILKALYTFFTLTCVLLGFFLLFTVESRFYFGGYGIILMLLGPIVVRLTYEFMIMFVLLVKNVIEINKKLKNNSEDK